jgi:motility quorum-sensing regulator/GCU-specific mRNA interferase toxin
MEKLKPHCALDEIKKAFGNAAKLNRTVSAADGAAALGLSDEDVVSVILGLTHKDFYKSMTTIHDNRLWQDVYLPETTGTELYVKFTKDSEDNYLLISFKESES